MLIFSFYGKIVFWLNGRTTCSCRSVSEPETAHLLDQFVMIVMILLCALAADVICRFVILAVGRRIIVRTKKRWGELLFNRDVLRKFSNIVPVALIYILIPLAFPEHSETPVLLRKICLLYVIFVVVMFVNMLLKVGFEAGLSTGGRAGVLSGPKCRKTPSAAC